MQIDAQKIIDVLIEQRNRAQNELAQMTAYVRMLEQQIENYNTNDNDE